MHYESGHDDYKKESPDQVRNLFLPENIQEQDKMDQEVKQEVKREYPPKRIDPITGFPLSEGIAFFSASFIKPVVLIFSLLLLILKDLENCRGVISEKSTCFILS